MLNQTQQIITPVVTVVAPIVAIEPAIIIVPSPSVTTKNITNSTDVSTSIDLSFLTFAGQPLEEQIQIVLPGFKMMNLNDTFYYELTVKPANKTMQGLIDRYVYID